MSAIDKGQSLPLPPLGKNPTIGAVIARIAADQTLTC